MPLTIYARLLSVGGLAATVVLILSAEGVISPDDFERLYEAAVWACYRVPGFVEAHEEWIEVLGSLRIVWRALDLDCRR